MRRAGYWLLLALLSAMALSGCANKNRPAPVEDRSPNAARAPAKMVASADNAGKPGYYSVKSGDTLIRIGMDNGQSWRDIARWNNIENPNLIETGQVLRVTPPEETGVVVRPVSSTNVVTSPAPANTASAPTPASNTASVRPPASAANPPNASTPANNLANSDSVEDTVSFQWPTRGNVLAGFDEVKNKGIDIAGKAGDPVLAAADGKVVYAGSGLRGYGNLVILKHNNTYLTAYAHNQSLLVKEDQAIKRGQKIAEMGNSDADQVKLHFEIRRQGKPVDPAKYLPAN
ncbi:MAG: peptidoglycan DD-metalloendopeptidase family protein [Burkholderiales bacterium]|nr:peptidoglycan DD-metalloendopeptidase family protein [Burkholderiales bacterium]